MKEKKEYEVKEAKYEERLRKQVMRNESKNMDVTKQNRCLL